MLRFSELQLVKIKFFHVAVFEHLYDHQLSFLRHNYKKNFLRARKQIIFVKAISE
jgi:hypothetical protein